MNAKRIVFRSFDLRRQLRMQNTAPKANKSIKDEDPKTTGIPILKLEILHS
jgi:hypothetical protein